MPASRFTYYDLLGVDHDAPADEIQRAYRALIARLHPDVNPNVDTNKLTAALNDAWATLADPQRRREYDEQLRRPGEEPRVNTSGSERWDAQAAAQWAERARARMREEHARAAWEQAERARAEQARAQRARAEELKKARARARPAPTPAQRMRANIFFATLTVASAVIIIVSLRLLFRPEAPPVSLRPHQPVATASANRAAARPPTAAALTKPAAGGTTTLAAYASSAPPHTAAASQSARSGAAASSSTSAPQRAIAARQVQAGQTQTGQSGCVQAKIANVNGDGSVVATMDGRVFRVDEGYMRLEAQAWRPSDVVTVCPKGIFQAGRFWSIDHGSSGKILAVQAAVSSSVFAGGRTCRSAVIARIMGDGATMETADGRSFQLNSNDPMRMEVRNWRAGEALTICTRKLDSGTVAATLSHGSTNVDAVLEGPPH